MAYLPPVTHSRALPPVTATPRERSSTSAPIEPAQRSFREVDFPQAHPFEEPTSIIKVLKCEISELRQAVQAEQRQRADDIKRVDTDVAELHRLLVQDREEFHAATVKWSQSLITEVGRVDTTAQSLHEKLSGALEQQGKAVMAEVEVLRSALSRVKSSTVEKIAAQEEAFKELKDLIDANSHGDTEFAHEVMQKLEMQVETGRVQHRDLQQLRFDIAGFESKANLLDHEIQGTRLQHNKDYAEVKSNWSSEITNMRQVIEDFRQQTAAAMQRHWKTMSADFAEVRGHLDGLRGGLEKEAEERAQESEALDGKVTSLRDQAERLRKVSDWQTSLYTHNKQIGARPFGTVQPHLGQG